MSLLNRSVLSIRKQKREGYPCTFEHADFPDDRHAFYICPACSDLGGFHWPGEAGTDRKQGAER